MKFVVVGLTFGDEGKGRWVDYLTSLFSLMIVRFSGGSTVIRFNGGSQAGHRVTLSDGISHCFRNYGSGTLNLDSKTYLSPSVLIHLSSFIEESFELEDAGIVDPWSRIKIHRDCRIITPMHSLICRMKEVVRGKNRHGSVGMGVGEAVEDPEPITFGDLLDYNRLIALIENCFTKKLELASRIINENPGNSDLIQELEEFNRHVTVDSLIKLYYHFFAKEHGDLIVDDSFQKNLLNSGKNLVFEGAQGSLLDPVYGFSPHITKTRSTTVNAQNLINLSGDSAVFIGLLRSFSLRLGTGPFPPEDSRLSFLTKEVEDTESQWTGKFRVGYFDLITARLGLQTNSQIDYLALSCLDRLSEMGEIKICTSYQYLGTDFDWLDSFFEWQKFENKIKITAIKKRDDLSQDEHFQRTKMLFDCKPLDFVFFESWDFDISHIRDYSKLPLGAKKFISYIEEQLNVPVCLVSVGPMRDQVIVLKEFF